MVRVVPGDHFQTALGVVPSGFVSVLVSLKDSLETAGYTIVNAERDREDGELFAVSRTNESFVVATRATACTVTETAVVSVSWVD